MGDVGYLDEYDRFWVCGRKTHRVRTENRTLYTIPCEAIFNAHPMVYRSALIGVGTGEVKTPMVLVELQPEFSDLNDQDRSELVDELHELATRNPMTRRISEIMIRKEPLPVDIRHNSKIFREQLAVEYADYRV